MVQTGILEVVECILKVWLASKGFAVAPNENAGGSLHESRERQPQLEQRRREAMDKVVSVLTHAERLTIAEMSRIDSYAQLIVSLHC